MTKVLFIVFKPFYNFRHTSFKTSRNEKIQYTTHREELHKYITGIVSHREQKLLSIFCMPDHTHLLVGMKPSVSLSDLTRDIKAGSSGFIKRKTGFQVNFNGKEVLELFPIQEARLIRSYHIS